MSRACVRCLVSGKVQGVWYRDSTRRQAEQLGLTGSAVNLPDGRVEVVACGERADVEQLQQWLHQGPADARVSGVVCEEVENRMPTAFTIG